MRPKAAPLPPSDVLYSKNAVKLCILQFTGHFCRAGAILAVTGHFCRAGAILAVTGHFCRAGAILAVTGHFWAHPDTSTEMRCMTW
jgi:hypothetical protein